MRDKITIINENGQTIEANLITILTIDKYQSSYIVYNEKELNDGINEISFAKIAENEGKMVLKTIESQEELDDLIKLFKEEMNNSEL